MDIKEKEAVRDYEGLVWKQVAYLPEYVKEYIYKTGQISDLRQEVKLIVLELESQGLKYIYARRYAQRRLYRFLRNLGLRKSRANKWAFVHDVSIDENIKEDKG